MVHEQLYQTRDLARIEFGRYVDHLTRDLLYAFGSRAKDIVVESQIPPLMFDVNTAIPCGLIVNELVTNAIKHGFPESRSGQASAERTDKRIQIRIDSMKTGSWKLAVKDNGAGLPEHFDFRKTESLGMKIITALAEQMGAKVEALAGRGGKGATFTVTFRLETPAAPA
jgi:two-component sensor histidine kinase